MKRSSKEHPPKRHLDKFDLEAEREAGAIRSAKSIRKIKRGQKDLTDTSSSRPNNEQ